MREIKKVRIFLVSSRVTSYGCISKGEDKHRVKDHGKEA
jgi:hypothetical protein